MSLSDVDKIPARAQNIGSALKEASMPYGTAVEISGHLDSLEYLAKCIQNDRAAEIKEIVDVVEGLLANWPHTEASAHYKPSGAPVLMKDEALKRAALLLADNIRVNAPSQHRERPMLNQS